MRSIICSDENISVVLGSARLNDGEVDGKEDVDEDEDDDEDDEDDEEDVDEKEGGGTSND